MQATRKAVEEVTRTVSWLKSRGKGLRRELATLVLLLLVSAGVWAFLAVAEEVVEGDTHAVDTRVLMALRTPGDPADPLGPGWVEEIGRDLTALGGVAVLTMMTVLAAGYLAIDRKRRAAVFLVLAVGSGLALSFGLKEGFDRPRPDLVPHGSITYTSSFPSGHSMLSAVAWLTVGALLARTSRRRSVKAYFLGVAMLLTALVGVSRVYLGVHWPTDVLAGWTAGAAWALFCWLVATLLQRRGQVEEEPEEA